MMATKFFGALAVMTAAVLAGAEAYACEQAYDKCMFMFKGESGLSTYNLQPQVTDKAFTPIIVPKDKFKRIGVLNTNGIVPEFITDHGALPITQFGSQKFTPTHFKPFWIDYSFGSGIGHQTFQGDQAEVAKGKCVRVHFTSFQELGNDIHHNFVVDNRNDVPKSENKCVVFQTK